jgi:hypothetical protein
MEAIGESAPRGVPYRVYVVGGGTAVYYEWRKTSIDADLFSEDDEVFRDIQAIKERLNVNVEFVRPEYFVPPLEGSSNRHVYIDTFGSVGFYHYDPYAQVLSKIVRGFVRDLDDARRFITSGMVDPETLGALVEGISDASYARYPNLTSAGVRAAVKSFLSGSRS